MDLQQISASFSTNNDIIVISLNVLFPRRNNTEKNKILVEDNPPQSHLF